MTRDPISITKIRTPKKARTLTARNKYFRRRIRRHTAEVKSENRHQTIIVQEAASFSHQITRPQSMILCQQRANSWPCQPTLTPHHCSKRFLQTTLAKTVGPSIATQITQASCSGRTRYFSSTKVHSTSKWQPPSQSRSVRTTISSQPPPLAWRQQGSQSFWAAWRTTTSTGAYSRTTLISS